ncbi:hypothetical protein MalM25_08520 [Planctomycetes bacterium MalM25]|nr:hypothetical protein MalM25_08520 [Planctomycetes bacterium MalM25]
MNRLASVFGTAFLVLVGLQVLGLGLFLGMHDWAYGVHSKLFALTPEQFDLACYAFFGLMKTLGLTLFFAPWVALKLVARRLPD